jgi:hypothetical protein
MTFGFFILGEKMLRMDHSARFDLFKSPFLLFLFVLFVLVSNSSVTFSAEIKLAWDPNTEPDLAGYKIYYGTSARTGTDPKSCGLCGYSTVVPVGKITSYTLGSLINGQTYYVSLTSTDTSNNESGFSNEVNGPAKDPTASYTVATNPTGLQVVVDGMNYTAPQTFSWSAGSSHTLSGSSPQPGGTGTRYVYSSWSDGGGQSHTITVPSTSTTYTANFTIQYSLTTSVSPSGGGTVSPSGVNWYNSGQNVSILATANTGYSFASWAVDLMGSTNPTSVTMSGPKSVTANFTVIGETGNTAYVSRDGLCTGHNPCSPNVQNGIAVASGETDVKITQETYIENIILDFDELIALWGGWNTNFTSISSSTTIQGSITITKGTMILENIILK